MVESNYIAEGVEPASPLVGHPSGEFLPSLTMVERPQFLVNSSFITPFPRDILGHELMRKLGSDAKFDNIYFELYRLKVEELVELLEPDGRPISIETSPLKEESNSRIWKQLNFGHEKHKARVAWTRRLNQLP